jgi:phosphohistidine phosphatase
MQHRLIVMRHAKSDWNASAGSDHERPLNHRGRRDAPQVAQRLSEIDWQPEHVISSDSRRTTETWERMVETWTEEPTVCFERSLYHAGIVAVRMALSVLGDDVRTAMVLGHNPGWEEVVDVLSGQDERMTTANAALLTIESSGWADAILLDGCWALETMLRPKEI